LIAGHGFQDAHKLRLLGFQAFQVVLANIFHGSAPSVRGCLSSDAPAIQSAWRGADHSRPTFHVTPAYSARGCGPANGAMKPASMTIEGFSPKVGPASRATIESLPSIPIDGYP